MRRARHSTASHDDVVAGIDRSPSLTRSDHFLALQRAAGNQAVTQLVVQRDMFNKGVAVESLTAAQAATELAYGALPGVTLSFQESYVSRSDARTKSGRDRRNDNLGFGEEYRPSKGSWVLHTHRGSGGGLLKAHTKPGGSSTVRADVDVKKAKEKGWLKDPDASHKPA